MSETTSNSKRILTVPNLLTLVRLALIGVMVRYFILERPIAAMVVYLSASATDVVDGYIARHFNQVSNVGKVLDPVADKGLTIAALVCMLVQGYFSTWLLVVIVGKELLMVVGGALIYFVFKRVVQANYFGKFAAFTYFLAVVLLFLHQYVAPWDAWFMALSVALNIISMLQYGYINIILAERKKKEIVD